MDDGFTTRAIRAATRVPRVDQPPSSVPIYQAATFASADADELGAVTTGRQPGYVYARLGNPTVDALADAFAELHAADAGFAAATGMAAIHLAVASQVAAGDRIVATRALYGTTRSLFSSVLARAGVATTFVDVTDLAAVEVALTPAPARILYLETISNPTLVVPDLAALASLAHRHGAMVVVDNTFASPYLCRPLALGADLVVESATKYLSGHSDVLAGAVAGSRPLIDAIRALHVVTGGTLAPFSAFLVLRGIPTLAIRMERHAATAAVLAEMLEGAAGVERVWYPARPSHPQHAVAAWRSIRSASVGMPRRTRNALNGASVPPVSTWRARIASISGRLPATAPARTSEWPDRYFVADSTTRSAPSARGRHRYGETNVLSTITVAPCRCPRAARASRSGTTRVGFEMVSR